MKYLSVCSGIEAASVAWLPLGWSAVAFSEIEPFPCKVLAHHHPGVPNWGDMTKYKEWPDANINVLVGGTPCQSFSIAGLRKGLDDPRGNLMLTYLAIAAKYRPEWLVWENVPGVLSSNGGRDFGTFLAGLGQLGYGFAYRVLDAQFVRTDGYPYAVPQRRRRVFVIGCLRGWQRAAAVLFDSESLRGNPPPRRESGKEVAGTIAARATGGGGLGTDFELAGGLQVAPTIRAGASNGGPGHGARSGDSKDELIVPVAFNECGATLKGGSGARGYPDPSDGNGHNIVAHSLRGEGFDASEDGTGRGTPIITCMAHGQGGAEITEDIAPTLNCNHEQPIAFGPPVAYPIDTQNMTDGHNSGGKGFGEAGDPSFTLGRAHSHAVAFRTNAAGQINPQDEIAAALNTQTDPTAQFIAYGVGENPDVGHCLRSGASKADKHESTTYLAKAMQVRRLTPLECERLQGFPDNHTNIPGASDSARYKALGNSMAVNVMQLIGQRIQMVSETA